MRSRLCDNIKRRNTNFCSFKHLSQEKSTTLRCNDCEVFVRSFIRPASSIKCYVQTCVNHNCTSSKEIECTGTDDDSCGFLNYTVGSPRLKRTDTIATRNCTRWSKNDCNQPKVCERYRDSWVEPGYTFSACSVMCCNWDLCNKKGKGKNNRGGHKNGKGEAKEVKNIQDMLAKMSSIRI
ncbi:hypothetical protein ACROYT_G005109 [Oculina patagonica]